MTIKEIQKLAYKNSVQHGFWIAEAHTPDIFVIPTKLSLIHEEVSEALKEVRNGNKPEVIRYFGKKPLGFPFELADIIIRVCDLAERYAIDLECALEIKMRYNKFRPYMHGKKF